MQAHPQIFQKYLLGKRSAKGPSKVKTKGKERQCEVLAAVSLQSFASTASPGDGKKAAMIRLQALRVIVVQLRAGGAAGAGGCAGVTGAAALTVLGDGASVAGAASGSSGAVLLVVEVLQALLSAPHLMFTRRFQH